MELEFIFVPTLVRRRCPKELHLFPDSASHLDSWASNFFAAFALGSIYYSLADTAGRTGLIGLVKFLASAYVVSWSGVVKFHGIRPQLKKCVFVANHSTMIDTAILLQHNVYSLVGQMHSTAYVSFIQRVALRSMNCIQPWENRDRAKVSERLRKHAQNENGNLQPLLIFPEGTCKQ